MPRVALIKALKRTAITTMGHKYSDSSSSDSGSGDEHKHHKDKKKKDKKEKKDKKHDKHSESTSSGIPGFPTPPQPAGAPLQPQGMHFSPVSDAHAFRAPSPSFQSQQHPQSGFPSQSPSQRPPPSGFRLPLTTDGQFPGSQQAGQPPCFDADGISPVFFGSALFPNAVHPCKVAPHLSSPCRVPYGGGEFEHHGRYDLLPFTQDMQLIPASGGYLPPGCHPIEGGYEELNGKNEKLYHAVATINGVRVPGKAGEHLRGANVAFGGAEVYARDYELLVWRQ
ncbi:hypothetical protein ACEPAF_8291 [Sanghuangporus sanghuang]